MEDDYMQKRKIKKWPFILLIIIIISIITYIGINNYIKKINSYEYKLTEIGYNDSQINTLKKKLKNNELDIILKKKYNKKIIELIKEQYFIFSNLDNYLKYDKTIDEEKSFKDIVAIVNVGTNKEFYTQNIDTDINLNEKMLVNKYHNLTNEYKPDDLKELSNTYAYGNNQYLRESAYNAFISMFNKAKKDNITLIINSSYRPFSEQEQIYSDYSKWYGEEEADKIAARPGYSEHQTGYALDIQSYNTNRNNFEESDAYKWLDNNAYKYGFILRYPKNKEYLTGYDYESWHFRYVGKKIAKYIKNNNITYDEYYAYFIEKK